MVRTEADMVVNQNNQPHINHHRIIHHRGILYNIINLLNFFMRRNCDVPTINTMMIMKIKGLSMEGEGDSLILTLIGEVKF